MNARMFIYSYVHMSIWAWVLALGLSGCRFGVTGLPIGPDDGGDAGGAADGAVADAGPGDLSAPAPMDQGGPDGPRPGELGAPCMHAGQCPSGFCVDGVCCEEACDPSGAANLCKACNVPGFEGRCVHVLDGTDPRAQCPEESPETCGRDGLCDGVGKCRRWGRGTACGEPVCAAGTITYAPACDGQGQCVPGTAVTCAPYVCADGKSCATSCTSEAQCAPGVSCSEGSCGKRANGQPCQSGDDCLTGHCAQGVCCGTPCSVTCYACNIPGWVGQCTPVPAGADPLDQCAAEPPSSCGRDGTCDGKGGCRLWSAGTPCAGPSCMGDSVIPVRTCSGLGICLLGGAKSCGPYGCDPASATCHRSCTSDAQCALGRVCNGKSGKCK